MRKARRFVVWTLSNEGWHAVSDPLTERDAVAEKTAFLDVGICAKALPEGVTPEAKKVEVAS